MYHSRIFTRVYLLKIEMSCNYMCLLKSSQHKQMRALCLSNFRNPYDIPLNPDRFIAILIMAYYHTYDTPMKLGSNVVSV